MGGPAKRARRRKKKAPLSQLRIRQLAADPRAALVRWRRLSTADRFRLLEAMRTRFDVDFYRTFHKVAQDGQFLPFPPISTAGSHYDAAALRRRGYHYAHTISGDYQRWVHPDGREIHWFRRARKKQTNPPPPPPAPAPIGAVKGIPDQLPKIESVDDAVAAYGEIIADKIIEFGMGHKGATGYDDGTIELVDVNTGQLTTLRPIPGSAGQGGTYYWYYDDSGKKDGVLLFDPTELFQP